MKNERHLDYWVTQPLPVCLVIRQTDLGRGGDEGGDRGQGTIRWMNVTDYLRKDARQGRRQIVFHGEKLDRQAMGRVRVGLLER
uniref:DUF4365 domain-containing protein n=1 Tax=Candidatus Kentrum eta TaxID=2126337 RepID=A0A450V6Z4_9GAMM|nr:MAG: Domain of unknown function (DUF4365) [Candidatus Kentron sp. H]VFJ93727.1 MAG: Domain of unknown function (DUF4365) [Candidatus Kentron sp. H]VFK00548.1 MAG: Domain of unknown function (DUF4365) [Candidatus Kentron sp. H]